MEFVGELPYTEKNNKKKAVHQVLCLKEKNRNLAKSGNGLRF